VRFLITRFAELSQVGLSAALAIVLVLGDEREKIDLVQGTRRKGQMSFLVIFKGERFSGSYGASTVAQAVDKAETFRGRGTVTIVDPDQREWTPGRFDELLQHWPRLRSA
jgi:hypothetical protein